MIIKNWRKAPRMLSFWVGSAATAFGLLPEAQQIAVLQLLGVKPLEVPAYVGIAFLVARFLNQDSVNKG